jgi:replicative superfamily II helicase
MDLAEPHLNEDGQALVFVSSRRDTVEAAKKARDVIAERDIPIGARGDYDFHTDAEALENDDLRASVVDGVAFHHAGLSKADKDRVEEWFREGQIDLLFSTSTLAWGVNLPARCVVIRDTKYHDPLEGEVDMSPLDVLQMLGRAGRPDYDDVGYGWVVCAPDEADRYRSLLEEGTPIESRLEERLDGHLNAEIATGTIESVAGVQQWLETTFYAVRARNDPARYDFETLQTRVRETVESLVDRGFVETDADGAIAPTALGTLTSRYYLDLSTAERFHRLVAASGGDAGDRDGAQRDALTTRDVLWAVAGAAEFDSVTCRSDETDAVDAVLSDGGGSASEADGSATDALTDGQRKVLAILRSGIDGHTPDSLRGDAWAIRRNADRLLAALRAFCDRFADPETANLVSRVAARLEDDVPASAVGLLAIDGVGATRARRLAETGIESPAAVRDAGVDTLQGIGLSAGVAEGVIEKANALPAIEVEWDLPAAIAAGERDISEVTIRNTGGGARAGVSLTVNGRPMTDDETYLGECTLPVACFGADTDELELVVRIAFPELPLRPIESRATVSVTT